LNITIEMKKILYLWLLLGHFSLIWGQKGEVYVTERHFEEDQWQQVTTKADYHQPQKRKMYEHEMKKIGYDDEVEPSKIKPKQDIKPNIFNFDWSGLKYVGITILVIIGAFLLYFFASNANWKKDKKLDDLHSILADIEDNLPTSDVATPLERAKQEQNFKVATRLYYLLLLQKMADKRFIKWSKEKTNRNYILETKGRDFSESFKHVTMLYEKAWFGKEDVTHVEFAQIEPSFSALLNFIQKL
jgi:hypothetical protein